MGGWCGVGQLLRAQLLIVSPQAPTIRHLLPRGNSLLIGTKEYNYFVPYVSINYFQSKILGEKIFVNQEGKVDLLLNKIGSMC